MGNGRYGFRCVSYFFKGYKENYKQSLIGGIFYTLLFVIMYVDYTVYMTQLSNLQIVGIIMLILIIILLVSMFNFFSMVAHYHMSIGQLIKNAVLLTLIRPFRVFSTMLGSAVVIFIGAKYPVLFLFFIGSVVAWFAFFNFYGTFLKMQDQMEKMKQKDEEEASTKDKKSDNLQKIKQISPGIYFPSEKRYNKVTSCDARYDHLLF